MNPFFFPLSFDSSANEPFIVIRKTFFDFRSVHVDIAIAALLIAGKDNNGIHLSMFRIILEHAYLNDIDIYEYMKSIYRNDTKIINNLTIHDIYRMPDDASPIDCEYEIKKNAYTLMEEVGRVKELFLNYFNEEKMISPYRFIEWAISCDSIKVPQQMIAWKATQDKKAGQQDIVAALTALAAKDAEMIALKTDLRQARQENAALQAELEKTRAELKQDRQGEGQGLKWYGLIAVVEQCRKEGKTPQEMAACLKGAGASWAMIGGLLHPRGELKDWQQYGKDLFNGSTKTLPW